MSRYILMITLVCTGELVFGLPFLVPRFFRPTMLEVFNFTNTQLGDLFFFYGITAMIAYFPGGALADKVSARSLITMALFSTAIGGLYMATIPGAFQMGCCSMATALGSSHRASSNGRRTRMSGFACCVADRTPTTARSARSGSNS